MTSQGRLAGSLLLLCLSLIATAYGGRYSGGVLNLPGPPLDENFEGDVWALLIAGSAGWGNYRHQADVLHAYQILRHGGVPEENIITMVQDDLAKNFMNPHPGKIYNKPGGPNVYKDVTLDYTGAAVTAQTFLQVLAGKKAPKVIGSTGKILKSGPNDRVFVYFADHGAPGILGMPNGAFLYADQLNEVLTAKSEQGGFKELVIYIEACESGSIFQGVLSDSLNIYATTASNAQESSWGTYCPGMAPAPPEEFNTCLGDLYSVAFLENSERADLTEETLEKQYELVRKRTSNNYTYNMGSHVMQFGALSIDEEPAADYLGELNTGVEGAKNDLFAEGGMGAVPQRDADLLHLWTAYSRAGTPSEKAAALAALDAEVDARNRVDSTIRSSVWAMLQQPAVLAQLQAKYANTNLLLPSEQLLGNSAEASQAQAPIVEQFVSAPLPRDENLALVDDWDCLRAMVAAWEDSCGPLDQYGMKHSRTFANLCNAGVPVATLARTADGQCSPAVPAS
ncbi:g5786 [Coccomyxa viridis]|uniref:G5786 protein n=1 Tax=Coccomyxa viridis TaxID=1274662 RepID=A0ABP1FTS3_9CHLO